MARVTQGNRRARAQAARFAVRGVPAVAYPIAAALIVTTLNAGGLSSGSQTWLIALAGAALLAALLAGGDSVRVIEGSPVTLALVLLAVVAGSSVVWTIGAPRETLRSALLILAYGALAFSAGTLALRRGPWLIALGIVGLAGLEAILGLGASALHLLPDAERIGGSWRPGGTFQYPPALGLLEIAALPALLSGLTRRPGIAAMGAFGAALAGSVLGSADSRLDLFLGVGVLILGLVGPVAGRGGRAERLVGVGVVVAAAIGAHLVLGEVVPAHRDGGGAGRLAAVFLLCAALTALSVPLRKAIRGRRDVTRASMVASAAVVAAVAIAGIATAAHSGPPNDHRGGLTHGRLTEWEAAVDTWLDRPILGAGSGTYFLASSTHQGRSATPFAHDLPLELAAELGVIGLALALALYGSVMRAVVRARAAPAQWLLGPLVAGFLLVNLVDWTWHLSGLGAIWSVAAGGLQAASTSPASRSAASETLPLGRR